MLRARAGHGSCRRGKTACKLPRYRCHLGYIVLKMPATIVADRMINYMPKAMRDRFAAEGREAGGWVYPKPTPALMAEGDCCITLHACPHGASMNVGPDPRMNMCAASQFLPASSLPSAFVLT